MALIVIIYIGIPLASTELLMWWLNKNRMHVHTKNGKQ